MNKINNVVHNIKKLLKSTGSVIKTKSWQGTETPMNMIELLHPRLTIDMEHTEVKLLQMCDNPKIGWARDHFMERISGVPYNPAPSTLAWSPEAMDYTSKKDPSKFSHTYPERYWYSKLVHHGYRYDTGDLNTLVNLLKKEPDTRQAVLPMFIFEDMTAALEGERVPCSLSWNFIIRDGKLDCTYTMRSCDAVRHLLNDIYFANMLSMYILERIDKDNVVLGQLRMNITSLHCFEKDLIDV